MVLQLMGILESFQWDATDGGDVGYDQIYQNGLREAYNNGWNTRYSIVWRCLEVSR